MKSSISEIFEHNIRLLSAVNKAVYFFHIQRYDRALEILGDITGDIKIVVAAVIENRAYFNIDSNDSVTKVMEMLENILSAQKSKDYVLLPDLLEMQFVTFISSVQELIVKKEDFCTFDENKYKSNLELLKLKLIKNSGDTEKLLGLLNEPLNPQKLLELGYRIEFTACGRMTVACRDRNGNEFYLHSNNMTDEESFELALSWFEDGITFYGIYGFGLGYHIMELLKLLENNNNAKICVYEGDCNILKLACAFSDIQWLLNTDALDMVFDENGRTFADRISKALPVNTRYLCHLPSLKNISDDKTRGKITESIPNYCILEKL